MYNNKMYKLIDIVNMVFLLLDQSNYHNIIIKKIG